MQDKKKKRSFLVVEIPEETRARIKIHTIKRNITLKRWVLSAITNAILKEERYE